MFPQRNAGAFRFEIPTRSFDCGFGHAMTAHRPHQCERVRRLSISLPTTIGARNSRQSRPGRFGPLIAVKRTFAGSALSPTFSTVSISHARQHNASFSSTTEACFEEVNERQADFAQFNRLDNQSKKVFLRDRHYAFLYVVLTTREISLWGFQTALSVNLTRPYRTDKRHFFPTGPSLLRYSSQ